MQILSNQVHCGTEEKQNQIQVYILHFVNIFAIYFKIVQYMKLNFFY
jgi:hypothetical protein